MFWFMVVALVVVVAGVAVVVLGAGGSLPEAQPDRSPAALPGDRPLTRADVRDVRIAVGLRGYRMDEVDALLDRLGAELELKDERLRAAELALADSRDRTPSWARKAADGHPGTGLPETPETPETPGMPEVPEAPEPLGDPHPDHSNADRPNA